MATKTVALDGYTITMKITDTEKGPYFTFSVEDQKDRIEPLDLIQHVNYKDSYVAFI